MVNVKSYSCFPTMVYEFDGGLSKQNHANMLNILDFENPDNNLHEHLAFLSFTKIVKECTKEINARCSCKLLSGFSKSRMFSIFA